MLNFPDDFKWGVATSSIQIEGGAETDGKSPSVWDVYVRESGMVRDGATPAVACDSYHRYETDIAMMKDLGVNAYRFSMSWPRILPEGRGPINQKGADYYNRLIDALLENGIEPFVTLYHWDMPQSVEEDCGWRDRRIADIFAYYAETAVKIYGDRVKQWVTFNEIDAFLGQGYAGNSKAPGHNLPPEEMPQVYHHVLLSHGAAVRAMRAVRDDLSIGCAENTQSPIPVIETPENITAAKRAWDIDIGRLFQPMALGSYPEGLERYPEDVRTGDMELIGSGVDFMGANIYGGHYVEATEDEKGFRYVPFPEGYPASAKENWLRVTPEAAYWCARLCAEQYNVSKVYMMENGFSTPGDRPARNDRDDLDRLSFLRQYLTWLHRAIDEGYPVRGYFLWSLMDSFEWISGFTSRFGIYHTDFETLERKPRLSAEWYKAVVRNNRLM
ncbi:MAG: glycoside hydrolase family 1 protein [Candidatus Sumerlaeota bacterium]